MKVIIAGAGGAAHLPGMVAAKTTLPVIGVPVQSKALNGLDSLLSIVQMPGGVPVATVAIGKAGAVNAGLLAAQICQLSTKSLPKDWTNEGKASDKPYWKAVISLYKQTIFPGATIGIIGGGQLGKMMAVAAKQMGYKIAVVDPVPSSPCGQVADLEITASYNDGEAIRKLAEASDVITYEFENIDYDALNWLKEHAYLPQGSELAPYAKPGDREKSDCSRRAVKVAPYRIIHDRAELEASVAELGLPAVLKTCRGGYDGKGQHVLKEQAQIGEAAALLQHGTCILESWVPFKWNCP